MGCNFETKQNADLERHISSIHETDANKCDYTDCGFTCHTERQLKAHKNLHDKKRKSEETTSTTKSKKPKTMNGEEDGKRRKAIKRKSIKRKKSI